MERKLSDIFADDPRNLSDEDLREIVKELRAQRGRWSESQALKRMKVKKEKPKLTGKLSLDELDLEL